ALTWLARGPATLFGMHLGEGAFYRVVPEAAMIVPALLICAFAVGIFAAGAVRFWRDTQGSPGDMVNLAAFGRASKDALGLGGLGLVIGTGGLLYLKWQSDRAPAEGTMLRMDVSFILLLFLTALTGLLLLVLRETAAMGTLLTVHLGVVAALFIMIPYGKFA